MPKSKRTRRRRRAFALSASYVEFIHDDVVSRLWPGDQPVGPNEYRDRGLVASATARPFQTGFGHEFHKSIFEKGAALFHSLIANHPFQNGNKRTAVLALDSFLNANSYFMAVDQDRMYKLATYTATYREKGIDHDTILSQITGILEGATIPFRELKILSPALYRQAVKSRRSVRNSKHNRQQP